TTAAEMLALQLHYDVYYEPTHNNPYLIEFYASEEKRRELAYKMNIHLFTERFNQIRSIIKSENGSVQDRTLMEDKIFMKKLYNDKFIDDRDFNQYHKMYNSFEKFTKDPDYIIYLKADPKICYERIEKRKREGEIVPLDYLEKLNEEYEKFYELNKHIYKFVVLNWNENFDDKRIYLEMTNLSSLLSE